MTHLTRKERARAVITAEQDGQAYCPSCGTPLNYDRGGLPNSSTYNTTTDTVTCSRCAERATPATSPAPRPRRAAAPAAPAQPSFTG